MEYTRDIATDWPNFADPACVGASALHIAHAEADGDGWRLARDSATTAHRHLALFLASDPDSPLNRARSFWTRLPDIAAQGATWEQSRLDADKIARVAFLEVPYIDLQSVPRRRNSPWRHQSVIISVPREVDVEAFTAPLLSDWTLERPDLRARGLVPWLLKAGLSFGVLIVEPDDSSDGRPGVCFYGTTEHVSRIRASAAASERGDWAI